MTNSRQAEAVFDASLFEDCRQMLLRLQGIIQKRQWDKLDKAEKAVVQSMDALKSQSMEVDSIFDSKKLEAFRQLSRLQRGVVRELFSQMNMNIEDQASLEQGMKHLKRLSDSLPGKS